MGYWHTGNTDHTQWSPTSAVKARDTAICTDKCTLVLCGNTTSRFDKFSRHPLVHIAASDALLGTNDYKAFPDLQMLPAVAGAVVPIYNIPEIQHIGGVLILSRSSIVNIFEGNIRTWNDPAIIADNQNNNNPTVAAVLATISAPINVFVRTDSSGTTSIFTTALSSFDPTGAYAFKQAVTASEKPFWCDKFTDEIQIITTSSCNGALDVGLKQISLVLVGTDFTLHRVSMACDSSAANVKAAFEAVYGSSTIQVARTTLDGANSSYAFSIGYWGAKLTTKNQYEPYVASVAEGIAVKVSTLQEGGFQNSHFNASYSVTKESQSIFVNTSVAFAFNITNMNGATHATSAAIYTKGANLLAQIKAQLNMIAPYLISVTQITHGQISEFQLAFNTSLPNPAKPAAFRVGANESYIGQVLVSTFLHAKNFPLFYDAAHVSGLSNSGKYSCYRHEHNLRAWSYFTGSGNLGVVAGVRHAVQSNAL